MFKMRKPGVSCSLALLLGGALLAQAASAQTTPAAAGQATSGAPKASGTVKTAGEASLVIAGKDGQDINVSLSGSTKVLIVPPGSTTLSAATPGSAGDIQAGDKALVNGTTGDAPTALHAARVIVMKSAAIADVHAAQSAAWSQGSGGIVKSANAETVVVSSGMKTLTITVTPKTIVRRYSPGSVKFEDAAVSTVAAIQPGDQLRVRGTKSEDGLSITADEIVTGAFANYSGTIASIDNAGSSVTLKDLVSKKTVTVTLTPGSDVRRLAPQMAAMVAMRMKGGTPSPNAAPASAEAGKTPGAAASSRPTGEGTEGGQRRANAVGGDLSRMLTRLPTETLGGLKPGEAVMIVASPSAADASKSTAITLLVGVEPILAAPAGQSTTLSPWNVSGGEGAANMGGGTP